MSEIRVLLVAPEAYIEYIFSNRVKEYLKVKLDMKTVDSKADMCCLHFPESSFDLVYTSHILEYIKLDCQVINEVKRVPAPGGISFLPVPKVTKCINEYFEQNPYESNNARAPGNDFFDRHMQGFSRVDICSSDAFDEKCHLYVYENMIRYTS